MIYCTVHTLEYGGGVIIGKTLNQTVPLENRETAIGATCARGCGGVVATYANERVPWRAGMSIIVQKMDVEFTQPFCPYISYCIYQYCLQYWLCISSLSWDPLKWVYWWVVGAILSVSPVETSFYICATLVVGEIYLKIVWDDVCSVRRGVHT